MPAGGMPAMCPLVSSDPRDTLIDDFHQGDTLLPAHGGRTGGWYIFSDGTGMLTPTPGQPPSPARPGYDGAGYALRMTGADLTDWGAGLGVTLLSVPGRPPCRYDATPQAGLRFYFKGVVADDDTLRVNFVTEETLQVANGGRCPTTDECDAHYGLDISPVPADWELIEVPIAELAQPSWGTRKPLDLRHLLGFEFNVRVNSAFDVWIDQVEFY
jgi:hypothetical protein